MITVIEAVFHLTNSLRGIVHFPVARQHDKDGVGAVGNICLWTSDRNVAEALTEEVNEVGSAGFTEGGIETCRRRPQCRRC